MTEHKYQNPDPRCGYQADGISYCWSYAFHKDGDEKFQDLESICRDCELFTTNEENKKG